MKACPYCSEEIQETARKCRFCGEWLDEVRIPAHAAVPASRSMNDAWAAGPETTTPPQSPPPDWRNSAELRTNASAPKTNGLAVAALVAGILVFLAGAIAGIPALVMGLVARRRISDSHGREGGRGMATAGIVLGVVSLALTAVGAAYLVHRGGSEPTREELQLAAARQDCHNLQVSVSRIEAGDDSALSLTSIDAIMAPTDNAPGWSSLNPSDKTQAAVGKVLNAQTWLTGIALAREQANGQGSLDEGYYQANFMPLYNEAAVACAAIGVSGM